MFDCGIHFNPAAQKYPDVLAWAKAHGCVDALHAKIRCVLITHFHLDHVGALPWLLRFYSGPVVMTPATHAFSELLLIDQATRGALSLPDSSSSAADFNVRPELVREHFAAQGADGSSRITKIAMGERMHLGPLTIKTYNAGHVSGAVMYAVTVFGTRCIYTGDMNTYSDVLIDQCDFINEDEDTDPPPTVLIIEGTYAIINKDSRPSIDRELCQAVSHVLQNKGKVLIPCLAVGKAQEIAAVLAKALPTFGLDNIPMYLGGTVGARATENFLAHLDVSKVCDLPRAIWPQQSLPRFGSEYLEDELCDIGPLERPRSAPGSFVDEQDELSYHLTDGILTLGSYRGVNQFSQQNMLRHRLSTLKLFDEAADAWAEQPNAPGIVFASSNMLTGGLALKLFVRWAGQANNMVVFTGKCVPGTVGEKVCHGAKQVAIPSTTDGGTSSLNVSCSVRYFPYANHAGHLGLRRFIEQLDCTKCVLVHGDAPGLVTLRNLLRTQNGMDAFAPKNGDTLTLNLTPGLSAPTPTAGVAGTAKKKKKRAATPVPRLAGPVCESFFEAYGNPALCWQGTNGALYPLHDAGAKLLKKTSLLSMLSNPPVGPEALLLALSALRGGTDDAEDGELSDEEEGAAHEDFMVRMKDRFKHRLIASEPVEVDLDRRAEQTVRCSSWIALNAWQDSVEQLARHEQECALLGVCYTERDGFSILVIARYQMVFVVGGNSNSRQALCQWWNDEMSVQEVFSPRGTSARMCEEQFSASTRFLAPLIITCDVHNFQSLQNCQVAPVVEFWSQLIRACAEQRLDADPKPVDVTMQPNAEANVLFSPMYNTGAESDGRKKRSPSSSKRGSVQMQAVEAKTQPGQPLRSVKKKLSLTRGVDEPTTLPFARAVPPPMAMPSLPNVSSVASPPPMKLPQSPPTQHKAKAVVENRIQRQQRISRASERAAKQLRHSESEPFINREFNVAAVNEQQVPVCPMSNFSAAPSTVAPTSVPSCVIPEYAAPAPPTHAYVRPVKMHYCVPEKPPPVAANTYAEVAHSRVNMSWGTPGPAAALPLPTPPQYAGANQPVFPPAPTAAPVYYSPVPSPPMYAAQRAQAAPPQSSPTVRAYPRPITVTERSWGSLGAMEVASLPQPTAPAAPAYSAPRSSMTSAYMPPVPPMPVAGYGGFGPSVPTSMPPPPGKQWVVPTRAMAHPVMMSEPTAVAEEEALDDDWAGEYTGHLGPGTGRQDGAAGTAASTEWNSWETALSNHGQR